MTWVDINNFLGLRGLNNLIFRWDALVGGMKAKVKDMWLQPKLERLSQSMVQHAAGMQCQNMQSSSSSLPCSFSMVANSSRAAAATCNCASELRAPKAKGARGGPRKHGQGNQELPQRFKTIRLLDRAVRAARPQNHKPHWADCTS